jgi:hypothetical protein
LEGSSRSVFARVLTGAHDYVTLLAKVIGGDKG